MQGIQVGLVTYKSSTLPYILSLQFSLIFRDDGKLLLLLLLSFVSTLCILDMSHFSDVLFHLVGCLLILDLYSYFY